MCSVSVLGFRGVGRLPVPLRIWLHHFPGGGGPSDWGQGWTCIEAQSAFSGSVFNHADQNCLNQGYDGVCGTIYEVMTSGCYFNGTMFQVGGYANHSCGVEICIERDPYQ